METKTNKPQHTQDEVIPEWVGVYANSIAPFMMRPPSADDLPEVLKNVKNSIWSAIKKGRTGYIRYTLDVQKKLNMHDELVKAIDLVLTEYSPSWNFDERNAPDCMKQLRRLLKKAQDSE